ncbi:hypothetical protein NYE70_01535 [Paenibacillus sp. FSL R5-0407]|uniref:hypothetical protein n=1 Tax=Paenibacillus TaxID=44249 RepID=UPI0025B69C98|nr:hypothetical protein [Paenibacillus vini]MDN4069356.1 hypothetical protein [Paenibacillus vini]
MGLHLIGILISILVMLPNLLFLFRGPRNMPKSLSPSPMIITILERVGQISCFAMPLLFGIKIAEQPMNLIPVLMGICLLVYYACWIRYFAGGNLFALLYKPLGPIPVPMALFPILYFILLGLWMRSYLFIVPSLLFAVGHFINSWRVYVDIEALKS